MHQETTLRIASINKVHKAIAQIADLKATKVKKRSDLTYEGLNYDIEAVQNMNAFTRDSAPCSRMTGRFFCSNAGW